MTMAAYSENRSNRYCKNYIRQFATLVLFLGAVFVLYKTFLGDDNDDVIHGGNGIVKRDALHVNTLIDNNGVNNPQKNQMEVAGSPGGAESNKGVKVDDEGKKPPTDTKELTLEQKAEECIKFRTTVLKKNDTAVCNHEINRNDMQSAILADSAPFKHGIIATYGAFMKTNQIQIVSIEVGCGTGAITLLNSLKNRKSIAIDPYIDNLKVLKRGLALTKMWPRVKQLWYSVNNTSALKPDFSWTPGEERRITLDDVMGHYMVPDEIILITLANDGYELEALQGAATLLSKTKICYILVDFSSNRTQETGEEIVKLLAQYDLQPYSDIYKSKELNMEPAKNYRLGVVFMTPKNPPCKMPAPPEPPKPKPDNEQPQADQVQPQADQVQPQADQAQPQPDQAKP